MFNRQTDRQTTDNGRSEKLTWAFSSGELMMKIKYVKDHWSEGNEYMYRFCPKWLYNLHEFGELNEIDSLKLMLIYQIHIGLTAAVTCQQRMLTPPRHLTPYTSGICRGPCKADFCCGLFHLPDLDTDLDCGYSVYLTGHTDFDCGLFRFPDLRHTDFDYWILNCAFNGA
jgi:hypothetical protein